MARTVAELPPGARIIGLHQSWRDHQDVSRFGHWYGAGPDGQGQHSSARPSCAGSYLLRDRLGALYAIVLSRGIASSIGRSAVASRSVGRGACGRQVGYLPSPHAAGLGASAAVADDELVKPIAVRVTRGAWYRTWRLVEPGWHHLRRGCEKANEEAFSRPGASRGTSAYPQIRFVSLVENGTHVLFGSRWTVTGRARSPWPKRCFRAWQRACSVRRSKFLWLRTMATGARNSADLLWRTKKIAHGPAKNLWPMAPI